jgi:hypothetical protein
MRAGLGYGLNRVSATSSGAGLWLDTSVEIGAGRFAASAQGILTNLDGADRGSHLGAVLNLDGARFGCLRTSATLDGERQRYPGFSSLARATLSADLRCHRLAEVWGLRVRASRYLGPTTSRSTAHLEATRNFPFDGGNIHFAVQGGALDGIPAVYRDSLAPLSDTVVARILERPAEAPRQFVQAAAGADWDRGAVGISLLIGARLGRDPRDRIGWAEIGANYRASERVTLVGSLGLEPGDPGFDQRPVRFGSVALRLTPQGREVADGYSPPDIAPPLQLAAVPAADGTVLLTIVWSDPGRLEVAGDFSDWQPLPLERQPDGSAQLRITLPPGTYRINVRVAGGPWFAPPGLPQMEDEFGGRVGILTIPATL